MKVERKKVISKNWDTIKGLIKEIGLKEGIKLMGGRKELGYYNKQGEPREL